MVKERGRICADAVLVEGLQAGEYWARTALFDHYASHVCRVLSRVLGRDAELADVLHDTFVQAYDSVGSIRDATAIRGWLSQVAVFTAKGVIRRRHVRRWLHLSDPSDLPEPKAPPDHASTLEALRRARLILETLGTDDRTAFTLRYLEGMDLTEVAAACSCSVATAKRRIGRARESFLERARQDEILTPWVAWGRWAQQ